MCNSTYISKYINIIKVYTSVSVVKPIDFIYYHQQGIFKI